MYRSLSRKTPIALAVLTAGWISLGPYAGPARADLVDDMALCGKRIGDAIGSFTDTYLEAVLSCHVDNLRAAQPVDCATDESTVQAIDSAREKLLTEISDCDAPALTALCPLEAKTSQELHEHLTTGAGSLQSSLAATSVNLFVTSYAPACPRPTGIVSTAAKDCASRVRQGVQQIAFDVQQCLFDCEVGRFGRSGSEDCVDPTSGMPVKQKLKDCIAEAVDDLASQVERKCNDVTLTELGCPSGAPHVADLVSALSTGTSSIAESLNLGIFHSECRSGGGGPGPLPTATVVLTPSDTPTTVACAQVLDAAFFGSNTGLRFTSDLDCSTVEAAINGIEIHASNVSIDGARFTITGPGKSRYRTGVGVLLGPDAKDVKIKKFRQILRFGVGIGDSGNNAGLGIQDLTVIRNTLAGIRSTSNNVVVKNVTADRNAIGFDLAGDTVRLRLSTARQSTPAPGVGVYLKGLDANVDGLVARVKQNTIEGNIIGMIVEGGPHRINLNDINTSLGDGVQMPGTGTRFDTNSIKQNQGSGLIVSGANNRILSNRSDQNAHSGMVVTGTGNRIFGNGAGTVTDRGNLEFGFLITGEGNTIDTNRAEANVGAGFEIQASTALFKGNRSNTNTGPGFEITAGGSSLDTNTAEANGGSEFIIAPGNTDLSGNRANGATFSFDATGATVE